MLLVNSRLILFALCSFSIGTWVGYYWRRGLALRASPIIPKHVASDFQSQIQNVKQIMAKGVYRRDESKAAENNGICKPQPNVMFLKTHKTASSAVQNILLRYADNHNLTVGLSNIHDIRFHYGQKFMKEYVAPTKKPINMLCHHMVFNLPELQIVMPKNTTYVTILREPAALFESMFDYFHWDSTPFSRLKKAPHALEFWLNHTEKYFHGRGDGRFWWFAKNGIFFDIGYDNLNEDDIYIQDAITELDETFDLVLLSDYFMESMLLLKDQLCWTMEDILALKTNARGSAGTELTDRVVKKIRQWNKADAAIYDHFNETFWKKVAEYGQERMQRDLKLLEEMNAKLQADCVEGEAVSNKFIKDAENKVYNPRGVEMKGYNIKESARNNPVCINLLKGEIQWTREMMAKG